MESAEKKERKTERKKERKKERRDGLSRALLM